MAVGQQPQILYVPNDVDTGKTVHNYGSVATNGAVNSSGSCVEGTNFAWNASTSPFLGCFESNTAQGAGQGWIDTALTGQPTAPNAIQLAMALSIDSWGAVGDVGYLYGTRTNNVTNDIWVQVGHPGTSGFKLNFGCDASGISFVQSFDNLSLNTTYRLVVVLDRTTASSAVLKYLLDGGSVQTSASQNSGGSSFASTTGWIGRASDFTDYYGINGRVHYFAYARGTSWSSLEMAAINSAPDTAFSAWPGAGGGGIKRLPPSLAGGMRELTGGVQ